MNVTLEEIKTYLRVDYDDEDALLTGLITTAEELCANVARLPVEEVRAAQDETLRTSILYTVAYLYEHREEADHHELQLTLRTLLFGIRKAGF